MMSDSKNYFTSGFWQQNYYIEYGKLFDHSYYFIPGVIHALEVQIL